MSNLLKGEIILVDLGDTEGSEVRKVRPCVVAQNNKGNKFAPTTIIVPITHRSNRRQPTQFAISDDILESGRGKVDGMVLTEQIRTIDKCRIRGTIGRLNQKGIDLLDRTILVSMGIHIEIA